MTAISELVAYEREYPLELTHPKTGKKLGITFWVKHIDCAASTRAAKVSAAEIMGDAEADHEFRQYAACISRWDWGSNEFEPGKGAPEFSPEEAMRVLHHPDCKWIVAQVRNAVIKIGNFTND